MRAVGEHVWRHGDAARLQLYLLSLFPVVEDAAAQPGDRREGSESRLHEVTPGVQPAPPCTRQGVLPRAPQHVPTPEPPPQGRLSDASGDSPRLSSQSIRQTTCSLIW